MDHGIRCTKTHQHRFDSQQFLELADHRYRTTLTHIDRFFPKYFLVCCRRRPHGVNIVIGDARRCATGGTHLQANAFRRQTLQVRPEKLLDTLRILIGYQPHRDLGVGVGG